VTRRDRPLEPGLRHRLGVWVESPGPRNLIIALIVINAAVLGLETSEGVMEAIGPWLRSANAAIVAVFVVEISIKLFAFGPRFFRSGWNVFDFFVVGIALVPGTGPFDILRSLRILRVLRLFSQVQRLRDIVESLLRALPGLGWTALLLLLVFYVFGVMGTELFGDAFPEWFGSLGATLFSLFQVLTLESWSSGIARIVMETYGWAWLYFVSFILVATFMVLNLFIAIIVSATQSLHADEEEVKRQELLRELRDIRLRLDELSAERRDERA
jgi:voltage-gated sodium channel